MATSPAAIEARRARVAALLLARRTYRQMADELGAGLATIAADVKAVRTAWQAQRAEDISAHVADELARLAVAEAAIWTQIEGGSLRAIDRLVTIQDRRAKLLGLDAPTQQQIVGQLNVIWQGADPNDV